MIGASKATTTREFQLLSTTNITSTGAQSYTVPAGVRYLEIEMWGAGGGGGAMTSTGSGRGVVRYGGGGGGGGGYLKKTYYGAGDMQAGDTLNFTVGAGGAGGALNNPGAGGVGSVLSTHKRSTTVITTFSYVRAYGGGGGAIGTVGDATANGGAGGVPINGDINTNGNAGSDVASAGIGGQLGGAGGAGADPDGGAGGAGAIGADAVAGTAPGGGGGGGRGILTANDITLGAAGGAGKVIVKAYG